MDRSTWRKIKKYAASEEPPTKKNTRQLRRRIPIRLHNLILGLILGILISELRHHGNSNNNIYVEMDPIQNQNQNTPLFNVNSNNNIYVEMDPIQNQNENKPLFHAKPAAAALLAASSFNSKNRDVLYFDEVILDNAKATYEGASSYVEWEEETFVSVALLATVDRRPIIVRKQMWDDKKGLHADGTLLGCAISSATFVSDLKLQDNDKYRKYQKKQTCDVCFQFSNREDMKNFVPGKGWEFKHGTKCFGGTVALHAKFADWQTVDPRFKGYGYPWKVDCMLHNGIKELTCREITKLQHSIAHTDGVQNIYYKSKIMLLARGNEMPFTVHSKWPWRALMSHDDDRSKIAAKMTKSWNDTTSDLVPNSVQDLKLAHAEGPGYDQTEFENIPSLKSMQSDPGSRGGVHIRLISNLFHLIRNAPGSTHIIAVTDGQAHRSYNHLMELLETKISVLYQGYGLNAFRDNQTIQSLNLIPISALAQSTLWLELDMTLVELMRSRRINIHMVPIFTPSLTFSKSVCGGQYAFTNYFAARFAPDYHVMMFADGDTALIENSKTLQHIFYNRFFSEKSTKCAGHRMRSIDQYVSPENNNAHRVLECTRALLSNATKFKYAVENCQRIGHIVARTDSIYAFDVHFPTTLPKFLPKGVIDCVENDSFRLDVDEMFQVHLRDRQREPAECTCFVNEI